MAATKETPVKKNFYFFRDGVFTMNVKEKTETSIERKVGEKTYYDEHFKSISGKLRKIYISIEDKKDGSGDYPVLVIDMKDNEGNYECVQMYFSAASADTLLRRLPNVDLSKEITLTGMSFPNKKDDSKKDHMVVIYQGGEKIPNFYVKPAEEIKGKELKELMEEVSKNPLEHKHGLPELVKTKVKGKETWDNSNRLEFYQKLIEKRNEELQVLNKTKTAPLTPEEEEELLNKTDIG